jgi:DNA-binding transcriptional regulator YhcF (GntR family)
VTSPEIAVDTASPVPPYEQIRAQLATLIRARALKPGERLPSVRQLAADLRLSPGTVARAYQELEQASLVEARRGGGTRILPGPDGDRGLTELLAEHARQYVATGRRLGGTDQQILDAAQLALRSDRPGTL